MTQIQRLRILSIAVTGTLIMVVMTFSLPVLRAQSPKARQKAKPLSSIEVKQIDERLEKLQQTFEAETTAIVEGYERTGHYERAKFLLEVLLKLDPNNETIKKRIVQNNDNLHEQVEFEQRFDVSGGWTFAGNVFKDLPARVVASGEYKLNIAVSNLGPNGFPQEDVSQDLQTHIPTGALMGMIVTESHLKEKKTPEPFSIKSKQEFTPKHNGELYLKLNVPPNSKCIGELKLKLSGIARAS